MPEPVEGTTLGASTSSATAYPRTVDCCPLSVDYYESQISKADSLYKNYLPQYNFDEVKAAMEFFDSIRNEELAIRNYGRRKAIPNSTFLIPNYQCAKAHYYHAVGPKTGVLLFCPCLFLSEILSPESRERLLALR